MSAGTCRFCHCTEADPCRIPGGDTCAWMDGTRTVCTAPACQNAYWAESRRKSSDAAAMFRKRSPAEIHELIKQEKRAKRRASRAKRRQQRGAA
jgi:hypothetical protein